MPPRVTLLGGLALSLSALAGCLLTTSLADLTGGSAREAELFSVGGTVEGLEGASLTITGVGKDSLVVDKDGPFVFPARLASGATYVVTAVPLGDGRACTIENGQGHVGAANVMNVLIACPSANAELASLVLSSGVLSPPFSKAVTSYTAQVPLQVLGPNGLSVTTVTATASKSGSKVSIDGVPAVSGEPRAIVAPRSGPTTLSIVTRATDQRTAKTYTIALTYTPDETYVKAFNTAELARFGSRAALSSDGTTLAVGAEGEGGSGKGINSSPFGPLAAASGAAYIFHRSGQTWAQEAYVKPSNTQEGSAFGYDVALSADGNVLAVGSTGEGSAATGINGDQTSTSAPVSGAAYVFRRSGNTWTQEAYVKASNTRTAAAFGASVALSPDGTVLAVSSPQESSAAVGIDGDQNDTSAQLAGAVYVFRRVNAAWAQEAYVKPGHRTPFGASIALAADGTLAVGAPEDASKAVGIDGNPNDTSATSSGAVFLFRRLGTKWAQEAYVKASNSHGALAFGTSVALSQQDTLAVGAPGDSSSATGINGDQKDTSAIRAGAVYLFRRSDAKWKQEAYLKASNTLPDLQFARVTLSSDGKRLAVGGAGDSSTAAGINGDPSPGASPNSGAAYIFFATGATWAQGAYVKPLNTAAGHIFGINLALSGDGTSIAICAPGDSSGARGINGNGKDHTAPHAGAVHIFR